MTTTTETTTTSAKTEIVQSLDYLAEMCGDVTLDEAGLVCDALIEQGLLDWESDETGGHLAPMTDEAFYAIVTEALA